MIQRRDARLLAGARTPLTASQLTRGAIVLASVSMVALVAVIVALAFETRSPTSATGPSPPRPGQIGM